MAREKGFTDLTTSEFWTVSLSELLCTASYYSGGDGQAAAVLRGLGRPGTVRKYMHAHMGSNKEFPRNLGKYAMYLVTCAVQMRATTYVVKWAYVQHLGREHQDLYLVSGDDYGKPFTVWGLHPSIVC